MKLSLGILLLAAGGLVVLAETSLRRKHLLVQESLKSKKNLQVKKPSRQSRRMDEALEDSFPASDPPAWNS